MESAIKTKAGVSIQQTWRFGVWEALEEKRRTEGAGEFVRSLILYRFLSFSLSLAWGWFENLNEGIT